MRFSPAARLEKYKGELIILGDEKYMGAEYDALVEENYANVKSLFFNEVPYKNYQINRADIINNIENSAYLIDSLKHNLILEIVDRNGGVQTIIDEINGFDSPKIKNSIIDLYSNITEENIVRDVLISKIGHISRLMDDPSYEYTDWKIWLQRFENVLQRSVKISEKSDSYNLYKAAIMMIKEEYLKYLIIYAEEIKEQMKIENDSINSIVEYDVLRKRMTDVFRIIQEREWRKFRGLE